MEEGKGVGGAHQVLSTMGAPEQFSLASPGLPPNRAGERATQLPVPTQLLRWADAADRDLLRHANMRPRMLGAELQLGRRLHPSQEQCRPRTSNELAAVDCRDDAHHTREGQNNLNRHCHDEFDLQADVESIWSEPSSDRVQPKG